MIDISWVRQELVEALEDRRFVTDKTGVRTVEVIGYSFWATEPVVFGEVNEDWARREIAWYESQSLSVNDIEPPIPEIWRRVADRDGLINSNYGWMIYSDENGRQYDHVLEELRRNPDSRRGVMIYNRPDMWSAYDLNGRSDFCCTMGVEYFIRDGRLNAVVQMRSSDLIYGYKGDRHWQDHVLQKLAVDLGVKPGHITWQAGSAHVYERHFHLIDNYSRTGELSISKEEYRRLYPESEWA